MDAIDREFGRLLKIKREDVSLSQQELASKVGLSRTSITNMEQGRQPVSLKMLYSLASALGTSPTELLPAKSAPAAASAELESKLEVASIHEAEKDWIRTVVSKSLVEKRN